MVYFTGKMYIKVVAAANLQPTNDDTGHSACAGAVGSNFKPYIALDIDGLHFAITKPKTKTIKPEYNAEFESDVHNAEVRN